MSVGHTAVTTSPVIDSCGDGHDTCGIRDVLERLGDTWSVLVISELAQGMRRFRELQRAVSGISQRMLTLTLRRLERDGLISRTVHPTVPPKVEYELTPMGHSLTHLIKSLVDWSADHREAVGQSRGRWDAANPQSRIH